MPLSPPPPHPPSRIHFWFTVKVCCSNIFMFLPCHFSGHFPPRFNVSWSQCGLTLCMHFGLFCRHASTGLVLSPLGILGTQHLWHFLHPCCSRALFHRRFHCLLHHFSSLHVLPHAGQQPVFNATRCPAHSCLVSLVFLLWVTLWWDGSKWVRVAFQDTTEAERPSVSCWSDTGASQG